MENVVIHGKFKYKYLVKIIIASNIVPNNLYIFLLCPSSHPATGIPLDILFVSAAVMNI